MAQWMGQFTGNTHATKVRDLEGTLRKAIASLKSMNSNDPRKCKAIVKLAERLLRARTKMLVAHGGDRVSGPSGDTQKAAGVKSLERRQGELADGGVGAILREFGVANLDAEDQGSDGP